ncbi:MAG: hypothetical protein M1405_02360 [Patescibacteria group bacterium]|nr:hypothetical protein [Patescibacteria group bacterium]
MNPNAEPQPGATPQEVSAVDPKKYVEENIANLSPEDYLNRSLDRAIRELPNIDPEALRGSAERVSRYLNGRLQGIDGQPLSDRAAEAALASIRLEHDDRVNNALLELAGSPGEAASQQVKDAALNTLLLGTAIRPDADFDYKIAFDPTVYQDATIKIPVPEELFQVPNLDMDTKRTDLTPIDLKGLHLRGKLHPANLVQGMLRMIGRGRSNTTEPGSNATTNLPEEQVTGDTAAQDKIREALSQEAKPDTGPQPAPPIPQASIAH